MHIHYFSVPEKQMMLRGLYLVAQQSVNKVENAPVDECSEDHKDSLVELAQAIDALIENAFKDDKLPGTVLLDENDSYTIYKSLQHLNIYANSIRDLWLKGGCLDQCLYNISVQMSGQVNNIINNHFSDTSFENASSTEA